MQSFRLSINYKPISVFHPVSLSSQMVFLSNSPMGDLSMHSWAKLPPCHAITGLFWSCRSTVAFYGNREFLNSSLRGNPMCLVLIPHPGSPLIGSKGAFTGPQDPWSFQVQRFTQVSLSILGFPTSLRVTPFPKPSASGPLLPPQSWSHLQHLCSIPSL